MNKAAAIVFHYGEGKADFQFRASGKFEWKGPGAKPTNSQITQWDNERLIDLALNKQKSLCKTLLGQTDHKVISHTKYPDAIEAWKTYREALWVIQDSTKIETIPDKPF